MSKYNEHTSSQLRAGLIKTWKRSISNSLWMAINISILCFYFQKLTKKIMIYPVKNLSHRCTDSDAYKNNMSVSLLHQILVRSGSFLQKKRRNLPTDTKRADLIAHTCETTFIHSAGAFIQRGIKILQQNTNDAMQ